MTKQLQTKLLTLFARLVEGLPRTRRQERWKNLAQLARQRRAERTQHGIL